MFTLIIRTCSTMPFYAVRVGKKPGIYKTWPECQEQVKGFPKAAYKKFNTPEEAQEFIENACSGEKQEKLFGVRKSVPFKAKSNEPSILTSNRKTKLVSMEDTMRHEFIERSNLPTSPVVYTDGCCLFNGTKLAVGGIGVYWAPCHPRNISEYLNTSRPTNQIAELRAASRALESALEMGLTSVELRTDSMYTIKAMTEWIQNWQANGWKTSNQKDVVNKEEMFILSALCRQINVQWVHIPGHQGIYGNEQADRLAREGAIKG